MTMHDEPTEAGDEVNDNSEAVTPPASLSQLIGPANSGENGCPVTPGCLLRMVKLGCTICRDTKTLLAKKKKKQLEVTR